MLYSIFIALLLSINFLSNHAWAARPAQVTIQTLPKEDTRKVLLVFGDSLSAGYGVPRGQSYPDDLQRKLDAQGYGWRVVNLGISGDTTSGGLARINTATALRPAVVLLELGGNDGL
ncbi:MAG: GDSL-type esterase/lipase family protein, partial [Acidobacteriota bacterium]